MMGGAGTTNVTARKDAPAQGANVKCPTAPIIADVMGAIVKCPCAPTIANVPEVSIYSIDLLSVFLC